MSWLRGGAILFCRGVNFLSPQRVKLLRLFQLPKDWKFANLRHVRAFGGDFDVLIARQGAKICVKVVDKSGRKLLEKSIKDGASIDVVIPR